MALTPSELRRRKMNLLMAMSYAAFASTKASTWSPTLLFAAGEQGAWYDPSDFSTMFQDSAGTTPVTAVEQPVGLILDKSKGLALGAEDSPALSAYVTSLTGTWAASGANYIFTDTVGGQSRPGVQYPTTSLVAGWYRVVVVVAAINGATQIRMDGVGATDQLLAVGTNTYTLNVTSTSRPRFRLEDLSTTIGDSFTITSISIKSIAGNHASQSTAASRPVLSARVNLLTYTEQFDNAAWTKSNCSVTATNIIDPLGGSTADEVTLSAGTAGKYIGQTVTAQTVTQTFSVCIKAGTHTFLQILNNGDVEWFANVNASTGALGNTGTRTSSSIISLGNGWYCITLAFTPGTPGTGWRIYGVDSNTAIYGASTASTGTFSIWGADLRVTNDGVGIPAYQRVAAATDYDTSGFPLYLRFDGTDDSLATASMDFSATDKMSVFAGVRKLSDAAGGNIVSLGNVTSVNGSFELRAPRAAAPNYMFASRGTSFADANIASGYSAPITNVVTGIADIASDLCALRINGTVVASPTTDQGTGNYSSGVVFIGRFGGTALPFNGRLYSLIVRGAQSTDAQIASTEAWVNNVTKGY